MIAVLISQIVRINTMTGDLPEAQTRIETLETKAAATPKPPATPEPSTEPTATPEPDVYKRQRKNSFVGHCGRYHLRSFCSSFYVY